MNTESINTIKLIRETVNLVQVEMNEHAFSKQEKKILAKVLIDLDKIENTIINETLMEMADQLNSSNEDLVLLIADMEKASDKIEKISLAIKRVSKVIGVLAEITKKAIAVGIL